MNMKKLINILTGLAVMVIAAVSCAKEDQGLSVKSVDSTLVGDWHLTDTKVEGEVVTETADVYLSIMADGKFELYQKYSSQLRYTLYTGTCWSENGLLKGLYSDNTSWATSYIPYIIGTKLVLKTYDFMEEMTFEKKSLSEAEKADADVWTKSSAIDYSPIL
jgi:hypothetical protein